MQFRDLSPPANPTREEQRDALQKGLGRAMQWARAGKLDADLLLGACLHEQRGDQQCEDNRGSWLWGVANSAGLTDRLRIPILTAFRQLAAVRDSYQLCAIIGEYALRGDEELTAALQSFVERRPFASNYPRIGEWELVEAAGAAGLLCVAKVRGQLLKDRTWDWDDRVAMDQAIEKFGDTAARALLRAATDEDVRRFLDAWEQQPNTEEDSSLQSTDVEDLTGMSVEDLAEQARTTDGRSFWLGKRWARVATEAQLSQAQEYLWHDWEPLALARFLQTFWEQELPVFDARLIDLANHPHERIQHAACYALLPNRHRLVRDFAIRELPQRAGIVPIIRLFQNNYMPGDEALILEAIHPEAQHVHESHGLLMDVLNFLDYTPESDSSQLGVVVYALTPCSNCRRNILGVLHHDDTAPDWLLKECSDDADDRIREIVSDWDEEAEIAAAD